MKKRVVAMLLEPGKEARLVSINPSFKSLCKLVGGFAEFTWPYDEQVCFVVNHFGKQQGLPFNRHVRNSDGNVVDFFVGNVVVLGDHNDGEFDDLRPTEVAGVQEKFGKPVTARKDEEIHQEEELDTLDDCKVQVIMSKVESFDDVMSLMKDLLNGHKD